MRTLLLFICCLFLFSMGINAQSANSGDCRTAIPVCADAPIIITADGRGAIDDFDPDVMTETGCLEKGSLTSANIENNTSWLVFRAGTDGQVGFDIEALPSVGNTITAEWDFAVYGPDVDCADISNGTAEPIRCNYEAVTGTDFTGIGVNPGNGQAGAPAVPQNLNTYDEYLEVQAGEIYYILINNFNINFDDEPEDFMLTFTGSSVEADQNTALDCTLRDEFLGLDIAACEGDPDILLSALRSPAGADIDEVIWSVDYDDDGTVDDTNLPGIGVFGAEYIVSSPNTGRYFAEIRTASGSPVTVSDVGGVWIEFYGDPIFTVEILDTNLSIDPDRNDIEVVVEGNSLYEYALNGGDFQDDPIFSDIPPGLNTVIVNDKNGCGLTEQDVLVVAYPKFFTPNGDGINETWNIKGIELLGSPVVFIFDRYGKLLKQLDANTSWDGTYNGSLMPSSDYWFKFEYNEAIDDLVVAKTRKTHFTLKR